MEMLNKARELVGFRIVWTLDGRIYYLAEGSTKPQIFRNWTEVACFELWKKSVVWIPFLCFYFHCSFFLEEIIFVSNFSQVIFLLLLCNGIAPLIFCFDLVSTKNSSTCYFFLLSQFDHTFKLFMLLSFNVIW